MADNTSHDQLITEFCERTVASPADAQQFLVANEWNLSAAVTEYFTSQEEGIAGAQEGAEEDPQEAEAYTGPRTLDGRPAPTSAIPTVASSSRSTPPRRQGGIATLGSINQASSSGHGHGHDHDDDDDEDDLDYHDDEQPRDLFAGGEKSGLAVQDPKRNDPKSVVNDILKKAKANARRPGGETSAAQTSRFHGSGQTLGGDDIPSQVVPDPHASRPAASSPAQTRILHLWEDGFSIEDGPLRRFDDPQNAADLQMIRQGRAPLHLMSVRPDQPVDVQLSKHDEKYKAPPKVYKPFSGGGQRLGSPTPGGSGIPSATTAVPAPAASSTTPATPEVDIDATQPTLSLRIQLANGTRIPARFNTSHTIGDVYGFIERAYPETNDRPWVLATTFPSKDHTDKSLVLGDIAEFKRGGTAVQKWT